MSGLPGLPYATDPPHCASIHLLKSLHEPLFCQQANVSLRRNIMAPTPSFRPFLNRERVPFRESSGRRALEVAWTPER